VTDPLEKIETAAKGARLLAISFVQYLTGYPCRRSGQSAKYVIRHGSFTLSNAIQGLGVFPLTPRACHIDALRRRRPQMAASDPKAAAILYISHALAGAGRARRVRMDQRRRLPPRLTALAIWPSATTPAVTNAGRLTPSACFGLRASMEFLLEVGREIAPAR